MSSRIRRLKSSDLVLRSRSSKKGQGKPPQDNAVFRLRRARIIERLQGLADDTLLEGCEMAARLMYDTAQVLEKVLFEEAFKADGDTSTMGDESSTEGNF